MNELVKMLSTRLGVDESGVRKALGGLLQLIRTQAGEGDFKQLLAKIPGAESLMRQDEPAEQGLAGAVGSALGGRLGAAAGLAGTLRGAGVDPSQAGTLVQGFVGYAKKQAGPELVDRIVKGSPELAKLAA